MTLDWLYDQRKSTPLHLAAQDGHVDVITALLGAGADVHAVDVVRATNLHRCADLSSGAWHDA